MKRLRRSTCRRWICGLLTATMLTPGCCLDLIKGSSESQLCLDAVPIAAGPGSASQLSLDTPPPTCEPPVDETLLMAPDAVGQGEDVQYRDITLQEAVQMSLAYSTVMRDLGGTILRSPDALTTAQDPALVYTDPRFGEEAALSMFDANLSVSAMIEETDRLFNNTFIGDLGFLQQDLGNFNVQLSKRAATGTQLTFRHITDYNQDNSIGNRFGSPSSSWDTLFESELRQPLLQGAGIAFNRIAGPNQQPGVYNGVLLARTRTDQSLADFEVGVRDLVTNVENAYWDLYFAYRDLDAKITARDKALTAWRETNARVDAGAVERSDLLQAEEQYWRFQTEVVDALTGRIVDSTRTNNGSTGGTFRSTPGVRVAERRLRLAMGVPVNDAQLLRPVDEPPDAPIRFDWPTLATQSLALRPELRKQRWRVRQRELELLASKNYLLPRLDAVGRWRNRGFGEVLLSEGDAPYRSAIDNLLDREFQEWQFGLELQVPLGYRQAHAGVRNAELALARESALLEEQKRTVLYGLSNAVSDVARAYELSQLQYNRLVAAQAQSELITEMYNENRAPKDLVLEADRRVLDAEVAFHRSRVEYAVALKNVHFEQGTLLDFYNIHLAEGASRRAAELAAARRRSQHFTAMDYVCQDVVLAQPSHPLDPLPEPLLSHPNPVTVPPDLGGDPEQLPPLDAGAPVEFESPDAQPE